LNNKDINSAKKNKKILEYLGSNKYTKFVKISKNTKNLKKGVMSSAVGIDLGSSRTVIGAVVRGGVEIIANESSTRETANYVGYGEVERLLGDAAYSKFAKNYKNTANNFTRILAIDFNSPEYRKEKKHIFGKMIKGEKDMACYQVKHQNKELDVNPIQVLASHLNKVEEILKLNNISERDIVVTVPGYFTIDERQAVQAAGQISNLNIVTLAEESECNVKNYGIFRRRDLSAEPRVVVFVDFGHSKTSVYFTEITNKSAKITYEESNRHLGARDLDVTLYEHFKNKFEQDTNNNTDEDPKARLRLIQAIEGCRKVLSANEEAGCNVEFLMEEEDFSATINRETFEKMCSNTFGEFRAFLRGALMASGLSPSSFHSVEILGGATRIPLIQSIICEELKVATISKTLDLTESCARGCAIKAAEKSPNFQVANFEVQNCNKYNIKCNYLMNKKSEGEVKELTGSLFKKGCLLPTSMSVSVGATTQSKLEVYYDEPVPERARSKIIFNHVTDNFTPKEEDFKLILRAAIDESGIPVFKSADLEEYYVQEVKTEIKKEKKKEETMAEEKPAENTGDKMEEEKVPEEPEYEIK
jgi:heat shock 70kDa protein 4